MSLQRNAACREEEINNMYLFFQREIRKCPFNNIPNYLDKDFSPWNLLEHTKWLLSVHSGIFLKNKKQKQQQKKQHYVTPVGSGRWQSV